MTNPFYANMTEISFVNKTGKSLSLRFTQVDGRVYAVMADLWPHLDHRDNPDASDHADRLYRAAVAFKGDEFHVVGDGAYDCFAVEDTEIAYLSREATTLLAWTVYSRAGGLLDGEFYGIDVERMFDAAELALRS